MFVVRLSGQTVTYVCGEIGRLSGQTVTDVRGEAKWTNSNLCLW